ncbi:MAG: hypothetical protein AUK48_05640 [Oscillatoriales cyanobacterium CG2_30_44_21]|nr:MAG: hypothetical protein AUK48_05640 [Oscillatoriales cyanobacterium CG2_30_44_21]
MSNIFLLPQNLSKRERFALSWEYLLENVPELGQELVDFLTQRAGNFSSEFIKATTYPYTTSAEQPDILLECQDFDIVCEHRLESELSTHSLEDLLKSAIHSEKLTYVALISNSYCLIDSQLLDSEAALRHYLQPRDNVNTSMPYFCWQDIYALVAQSSVRLAYEFSEYMHFMDMQPWQHSVWGNLFLSPDVASTFSRNWRQVVEYFDGLAVTSKLSGYSGLEVTYPLPWLQLLYLHASRSVQHSDLQSVSPYLVATIWIKGDERDHIKALQGVSSSFELPENPEIMVEIRASLADGLWMVKSSSRPKLAATYYTSLDRVVSANSQQMQQNLLHFVKAVFSHAQSITNP